jgi:hypothetical protein
VVALSTAAIGVYAQASQPQPYKVVFDLTRSDPIDQQAVLRWINEVKGVNPANEVEVVMYGRGLDLITASKPTRADEVAKAMSERAADVPPQQNASPGAGKSFQNGPVPHRLRGVGLRVSGATR